MKWIDSWWFFSILIVAKLVVIGIIYRKYRRRWEKKHPSPWGGWGSDRENLR